MNFLPRLFLLTLTRAQVVIRAALSQVTVGANVLCRDEAGRILLVRPRLGSGWSLPGGGVGTGEPPEAAALRELREETGHSGGDAPEFFGLYTRRVLWAANLIAVYRIEGGAIAFKPGFEIAEAGWFDPEDLPPGTHPAVRRRLAEVAGKVPLSRYW